MHVEILCLCDYAKGEQNGKLNILGVFNQMQAPKEPVGYPLFSIAARLRFERNEAGPKTITLSFVDWDGKKVIPDLNAQLQVQMGPEDPTATLNFAVIIPQISLPHFGEYSVDLAVNGRQEASIPLYVRQQKGSSASA